jgi:hypothetical protein
MGDTVFTLQSDCIAGDGDNLSEGYAESVASDSGVRDNTML